MKIAYIRWRDAVAQEATSADPPQAKPALAPLQEVGFLLAESDEAVLIGMEVSDAHDVAPGRWRLHVPRNRIQEMVVIDLENLRTPPPRRKRSKKP